MKSHVQYLLIAVLALLFASCKKSNTQGRYIPASAAIAIHIDGKSLSGKLPWSEIKNNPLFKDAYADSSINASLKKILDNPENSGIDTQNDLLCFIEKDSIGGYVAFEGTVKDEAAFKEFINEVTENGSAIEKDGVNYVSHFPVCVGWTKEKFVVISDAPEMKEMDALSKRMMNDSIDVPSHRPRDISLTCRAVFTLDKSKSLAGEEKFTKLLKEPGDMHLWINSEQLSKNSTSSAALSMLNLDKLMKGNVTAATLNFDDGKIAVTARSYAGEELTKLYKKYGGGKVSEDMLKRMPGKDVLAVFAINFKPEGLREFLRLTNLDGFINIGAASLGFNLDDFVKANKGDLIFGVSDFKLVADTSKFLFKDDEQFTPPIAQKPNFNFIFAASVGDKDAFNKLIAAGKKATAGLSASGEFPVAYNSNGTYFALSNSQENADKYLAGAGGNFDFISKITGEAIGGYVNLQSMIKIFGSQAAKDSSAKVMYDASLKMWDNALIKGGDFSDGAITQSMEINLVDKNTNSLKQLNQYAYTISELVKEKQRKQKEDMMAFEDALTPSSLKDSKISNVKEQ